MNLFNQDSQAIFYNQNPSAIQRMLDYDFLCQKNKPSISSIVHPGSSQKVAQYFFGFQEVLIPIYPDLNSAVSNHLDSEVLLNFSSFRSN